MKKPLILVSDNVKNVFQNGRYSINGHQPLKDYVKIADKLNAQLLGYEWLDSRLHQLRKFERYLKLDMVEALLAIRQLSNSSVVLSTSEKVAIPFAALSELIGQTNPHVVIAHKISSPMKNHLFRVWPLHQSFTRLVFVSRAQYDYAINQMGIPEEKVKFVFDKVDHIFFQPQLIDTENYVLAVGHEQRDYETLVRALAGTGIKLIVCTSSPWSTYRLTFAQSEDTQVVKNISYQDLRTLYAQAKLVVVPLSDVDYAAGANTILEGMAMGKPLIVTRSRGIANYLIQDETGIFVSPADVDELRDAILSLWNNPAASRRVAANARQMVEEQMNLKIYVECISQIVQEAMTS